MKQLVLGILAHVDAGKTTLSEALLYRTGAIRDLGRVDHKNAHLDTHALERARGITIFSRQARLPRKDRDAARTLERVRVQVRVFVVHAPEVADRARAVEQRLGQRRLPGVHVRQDAQNQLLHKHLVKMQE